MFYGFPFLNLAYINIYLCFSLIRHVAIIVLYGLHEPSPYGSCFSARNAELASVSVAVILIGVCLIGSLFADKSVQPVIGVVGCLTAI